MTFKTKSFLLGTLFICASSVVSAAEIEVEDVQVLVGETTAEVGWSFSNSDAAVTEIFFDITFDDDDVSPQTTTIEFPPGSGLQGESVDGCLSGVSGISIQSCILINPTTVRVSLDNSPNALPDFDSGSITFDLDAGLEVDDQVPLELGIEDLLPADADVGLIPGSITIQAAPESSLSIDPSEIDFGTVDLGNMPQSEVFTIVAGGDPGAGPVAITSINLTGDEEFTIGANECAGATLAIGESCDIEIVFNATEDGESFTATLEVVSDADNNATVTGDIAGAADSVANLEITPPSGTEVNLGSGLQGATVSATATIENLGSAPGDFECSLTGDTDVFSASPLSGELPAGGSASVELSCALPEEAEDGDSFSATFSCFGAEGFTSEHDLVCSVSEFEPLPVPTMSNWSIALFAMLMLLVGGISIRFFRV